MTQMPVSVNDAQSTGNYSSKLQTLINILQESANFTPAEAKAILKSVNLSADELLPWADFRHPVADSYGRKLVFDGGHFEIMVMTWLPGDFSAIHDHGGAQWGAVQCFGSAEHYIYRFAEGYLSTVAPAPYTPGMVHSVDPDLIHQMGNPGSETILSLHVYGCAKPCQGITSNARIFDLWEQSIQYTNGGVFFCLPENKIIRREYGIFSDLETTKRHHEKMVERLKLILKEQDDVVHRRKLNLMEHYFLRYTT